jgi:transmembrane sensor
MPDMDGEKLARFISGQSTPKERSEIEARMRVDASFRELVASLSAAWQMSGTGAPAWNVDAAWREFQSRRTARSARNTKTAIGAQRVVTTHWPRTWVRAAAVVAVMIGGAVTWKLFKPDDPFRATQEFVLAPGDRRDVRLPDGTAVTLAPASRLRIAAGYGEDTREVDLEGQAVFHVMHDARRPFRVRAGHAVTEVLGTRFVVRAYADDGATLVALVEGRVRVRRSDQRLNARAITLRPGQVARATGDSLRIDDHTSVARLVAWTGGELVFENTPIGEAARELSRWYDVDVRFADPALAERKLTASFRGEPAEQAIDLIARALNLRYERHDRTVVLSAR